MMVADQVPSGAVEHALHLLFQLAYFIGFIGDPDRGWQTVIDVVVSRTW
jgi:hypothetical protein